MATAAIQCVRMTSAMPLRAKMSLFLMGAIVLSPWSSTIVIHFLHFPMSMPEILFVCFAPFIRRYIKYDNPFKRQIFWKLLFVWITLLCIGILRYDPFAVISTARSYLYMIVFYSMFSKTEESNLRPVYIILGGSMVGWMTASVYSFFFLIQGAGEESIIYGPMVAIPIVIVYSLCHKLNKQFFFFVVVCITIGIFAGLRRELVVLAAAIVLGGAVLLSYSYAKYQTAIRYFAVVVLLVSVSYPIVSSYLEKESYFLYYRVFVKTENLISGDGRSSGDDTRINLINQCFDEALKNVIPKGFLNKQYGLKDKEVNGFINDVPMLELINMLGIFSFPLVAYIIFLTYRGYLRVVRHQLPSENLCFVTTGLIMIMLLFLEGSFLTFPYITPITGFCLGRVRKISGVRW